MTLSTTITPRRAEVLRLVLASPGGMSGVDLAAALGINRASATEHLRKLRALGHLAPSANGGRGVKWAPSDIADTLRVAKTAERRAWLMRKRHERAVAAWCDAVPVHRIVNASQCAPMRPAAPSSVFHQAA